MNFLLTAQNMREIIFRRYEGGIGLEEYGNAEDGIEVWEQIHGRQLQELNKLLEKCEDLDGISGLVVPSDLFTTEKEKDELEVYLRILGYRVERDDGKIYFAW